MAGAGAEFVTFQRSQLQHGGFFVMFRSPFFFFNHPWMRRGDPISRIFFSELEITT